MPQSNFLLIVYSLVFSFLSLHVHFFTNKVSSRKLLLKKRLQALNQQGSSDSNASREERRDYFADFTINCLGPRKPAGRSDRGNSQNGNILHVPCMARPGRGPRQSRSGNSSTAVNTADVVYVGTGTNVDRQTSRFYPNTSEADLQEAIMRDIRTGSTAQNGEFSPHFSETGSVPQFQDVSNLSESHQNNPASFSSSDDQLRAEAARELFPHNERVQRSVLRSNGLSGESVTLYSLIIRMLSK